jgi:hypothetical protein
MKVIYSICERMKLQINLKKKEQNNKIFLITILKGVIIENHFFTRNKLHDDSETKGN